MSLTRYSRRSQSPSPNNVALKKDYTAYGLYLHRNIELYRACRRGMNRSSAILWWMNQKVRMKMFPRMLWNGLHVCKKSACHGIIYGTWVYRECGRAWKANENLKEVNGLRVDDLIGGRDTIEGV
ncbi:uncharacterized protein [Palaemon carinicauda]|uniref:uncharacterized protein n=1 Tax=Palaemon carinicauda TaxID=392227 RepID=UPI0035B66209